MGIERIYFFSRHEPTAEMYADLGKIDYQFRGTIDRVRREGDCILFRDSIQGENSIEANSIVVAVAPLPLQEAWLKAGVGTLLLPQNNREVTADGQVWFQYAGLLQVLSIEVKTKPWTK